MSHARKVWSIVVIGLGAIGRQFAELIAREPRVGHITLIDPQAYENSNLASQAIASADLDRWKVEATAARLQQIRRDLNAETLPVTAEQVPLGIYKAADAVVACVDSKAARQQIATRAWRAGTPLIDCGVNADETLSRVSLFAVQEDAPCSECAWSEEDYAAIAQRFRCDGGVVETTPTRSPAWLGAYTASLAAAELSALIHDVTGTGLAGCDIVTNLRSRTRFITARTRNPQCRFDHHTLEISASQQDPARVTFGTLLSEAKASALRVEPAPFVLDAGCLHCGTRVSAFSLATRFCAACDQCGRALQPLGSGLHDWISAAELTKAQLDSPLATAGILPRDVLRLRHSDGSESAIELPARP